MQHTAAVEPAAVEMPYCVADLHATIDRSLQSPSGCGRCLATAAGEAPCHRRADGRERRRQRFRFGKRALLELNFE